MPRATIFNRIGDPIMYKMNVDDTGSRPGRRVLPGESDGLHGDYESGTRLTVWRKLGDGVNLQACFEPGCNSGIFVIGDTDIGVYLGTDENFPE